jgi:hypothetical protein
MRRKETIQEEILKQERMLEHYKSTDRMTPGYSQGWVEALKWVLCK